MKKFIPFAVALAIILTIAGCVKEEIQIESTATENVPIKMTPTQACEYLDKIYIAGVLNVPKPSCGMVIPEDIPVEYLEIEAIGIEKNSNSIEDLLENKEIKLGEWIVFENLEKYSKAVCTVRIMWDNEIFDERTFDLLNCEDEKQEPGK